MSTKKQPAKPTAKALPLTAAQKRIIEEHVELFDKDLIKLAGMEGTSLRQVGDYRKRLARTAPSEHRQLADAIRDYIAKYGLPAKFGDVLNYEQYLRNRG